MNKNLEKVLGEKSVDDLMMESLKMNDAKLIKILYKNGLLNFKEIYEEGNTILHMAAVLNSDKVFEYAVKHKADVLAENKFGRSPLDYAQVNAKHAINNEEKERAINIINTIEKTKEKLSDNYIILN